MEKRKPHKVHKPHWYHVTTTECVLCGQASVDRERRYGRKPKDPYKRNEYVQDACAAHFL